jgi:hypothetical protein
MNKLITSKYNPHTASYKPYLTEIVNDETAAQLAKVQADAKRIDGFYQHKLETPSGTLTWGSVCGDMLGFVTTKNPIQAKWEKQ